MKISSVNKFSCNKKNISFKSVYPIVTWVKSTSGDEYIVKNPTLKKSLLSKFVRYANGSLKPNVENNKDLMDRTYKYIARKDNSYRYTRKVSTYTNDYDINSVEYSSYLITGNDSNNFKEQFGKPLGTSKAEFGAGSYEQKKAKDNYRIAGLRYLEQKSKSFKNETGIPLSLNVLFQERINKNGKKSYTLANMKFVKRTDTI